MVSPGHHKNVAGIHRLNIHECDGVGVLVADRHLSGAMNEIAKSAVHVRLAHDVLGMVGEGWQRMTGARERPRSGAPRRAGKAPGRRSAERRGACYVTLRLTSRMGEPAGLWPLRPEPSASMPAF